MSTTHVLCLQESRSLLHDPLHGMLADTHGCLPVVSVSSGIQGRAGARLAIYVASPLLPHTHVLDVDDAHGRYAAVRVTFPEHDIAIINVYVPFVLVQTARSDPSHRSASLEHMYDDLQRLILSYLARGMQVVVAGDFNAWVGSLEDRHLGDDGAPMSGHPARSTDVSHACDVSGELLVDMCMATSMLLCTGRFQDSPVVPSYVRGGACTRVDHVLVSAALFHVVGSHRVCTDLLLTDDHLPLETSLMLPHVLSPSPSQVDIMERLVWDPSKAGAYADALVQDAEAAGNLQRSLTATSAGNAEYAVTCLHTAIKRAGLVAGMHVAVSPTPSSRGRRKFPLWFDHECRQAYAAAAAAAPHQGVDAQRRLRTLLRRKKIVACSYGHMASVGCNGAVPGCFLAAAPARA